jgi:L-lysine 2,3-aminomutase
MNNTQAWAKNTRDGATGTGRCSTAQEARMSCAPFCPSRGGRARYRRLPRALPHGGDAYYLSPYRSKRSERSHQRQCVPSAEELLPNPNDMADPLNEGGDSPVPF